MKKQAKIFILQFVIFAVIFLTLRTLIIYLNLVSGFWIPILAALCTSITSPRFKVFHIQGKDTVYMAWIFSKAKPIHWL